MDAPRPNRADGRIRICLVAAEHRPKTMRGEAVLDSGATRVRRATVNDLATVVALRLALLREYANHPVYGRLHPEVEARARPLFEQQLKATDQAIFLAEREGEVVGIARCADVKGSPLLVPDRYCYITSVFVRPEHRRHGVLGTLMGHAEDWARTRGLAEMRLHNSTVSKEARTAWDQLGFEVNEEVRLKHIGR
jgi:ribosomal protein S18 acetylase RimI-like enzyme